MGTQCLKHENIGNISYANRTGQKSPETSQTAQVIAIDFGCSSELDGKIRLLKTPRVLSAGHGENMLELSCTLLPSVHSGRSCHAGAWKRKVTGPTQLQTLESTIPTFQTRSAMATAGAAKCILGSGWGAAPQEGVTAWYHGPQLWKS